MPTSAVKLAPTHIRRADLDKALKKASENHLGTFAERLYIADEKLLNLYQEAANDLYERLEYMRKKAKNRNYAIGKMRTYRNEVTAVLAPLRNRISSLVNSNMQGAIKDGLRFPAAAIEQAISDAGAILSGYVKVPIAEDSKLWSLLNQRAFESLQTNPLDGIPLSKRIWKDIDNLNNQVIRSISNGITRGESGQNLSLEIRNLLINPEGLDVRKSAAMKGLRTKARNATDDATRRRLFARAAEIENSLQKPGTGVYRSAYKNSLRVTRTELTRSFHEGVKAFNKSKAWITGDQWNLSSRHPCCDICDTYAKDDHGHGGPGIYPAGEAPNLPHPHCLCYITSVMNWDMILKEQ